MSIGAVLPVGVPFAGEEDLVNRGNRPSTYVQTRSRGERFRSETISINALSPYVAQAAEMDSSVVCLDSEFAYT